MNLHVQKTREARFVIHSHMLVAVLTLIISFTLNVTPIQAIADELVEVHVKKGTNLIHLARDYCTSRSAWKEIANVNGLKEPYLIRENSTIMIPLRLLLTEALSAQVAYVSGTVEISDPSGSTLPLHAGDRIYTGQTVITGDNGYAQLIFPEHKYTRLESGSRLTVRSLFRLLDGAIKAELYLDDGRLVHSVKQRLKRNDSFNTRTAISITGIRGTEYRMKMVGEETNIVETLKGLVKLENNNADQVLLAKGQGSIVQQDAPITPPQPLPEPPAPPELADVYRTLPITIPTSALKGAESIRLRVTRDGAGDHSVLEQRVAAGDDLLILALEDGSYHAFFTIFDDKGFESPTSHPVRLMVRTVPGAPVISSPQNMHTSWDATLELRWLRSEQAVSYIAELASDPDFTEIMDRTTVSQPSYTTGELAAGTYYFRVKAVAEDGFESNFSQPIAFRKVEQPTMGKMEGSVEDGIHLQWPTIMENCTYDLQIGYDKSFEQIYRLEEGLSENTYSIKQYIAHGTYYVRIRATLDNGMKSQWTPPQKLHIKPEPLGWKQTILGIAFLGLILL